MSAAAVAVPKTAPPKLFAVPPSPFLVIRASVLRAFGGDHARAAVIEALMFRAERYGLFLQMKLWELVVYTENVASERTLRKILREFESEGYLKVESDKGDWSGLAIT